MMHYLESVNMSTYICGTDAVGRRHPSQINPNNADCILCRAMIDRNPVYVVLSLDEDGHKDVGYMKSIESQVEYAELIAEQSPLISMMYILLPDEIPLDDADAHFKRFQAYGEEMMY